MIIKIEQNQVPKSECLYCGYVMDGATGEGKPAPGSLSICYKCAAVSRFKADLTLEMFPEDLMQKLMIEHPNRWATIQAVRLEILILRRK